jgi:hypothetical protein
MRGDETTEKKRRRRQVRHAAAHSRNRGKADHADGRPLRHCRGVP